ncbi:hypothetical protein LZ198_42415 [Myxococcus sp. K15C18031901]|uniref:hypothetical protein n=1 Tax=Myxococcus dinghuensis TaxID=2906761 RepID=UPI0020A7EBD7|nr:hypothetical protein [Myxococcus dinghuensis]MCP3105521.1 hypothetical protein [Myxococcus dinghuensis]
MRKTWTLGAVGATLAAVLIAGGCFDFDAAQKRCQAEGRCEPEDGGPPPDGGCIPRSSEDPPDDQFLDDDCDGVDGQAKEAVFVDPSAGDDLTGDGTPRKPVRSVRRALELVREQGTDTKRRLFLAGGEYTESGLVVDVPVSLHGGYSGVAGNWTRSADRIAVLQERAPGLAVQDLADAGVVLEYVHIRAANGVEHGEPSIAMRVIGSLDVRVRHATLEAGLGAPGSEGSRGATGADGGVGSTGTTALDGGVAGSGGPRGNSVCPDGTDVSGGKGGQGATADGTSPAKGEDGAMGLPDTASGLPVLGGLGGRGGDAGVIMPLSTSEFDCEGREGSRGDGGTPGQKGDDGPSGTAPLGELVAGMWRVSAPQSGADGKPGAPGTGGGGGGGGGACIDPQFTKVAGGGGGGGGGGGCGGTGGKGGGGGGASIALLLFDSHVTVDADTRLRAQAGGRGGAGGAGGEGGRGGAGGGRGIALAGTVSVPPRFYYSRGGEGAEGGAGGAGGPGGAGGLGIAGPSVALWCGPNATVALAGDAGVTLESAPASGGEDGGVPGVSHAVLDCPNVP